MFMRLARLATITIGSLALAACGINSVPRAEENAKAKWADVQAAFQERANLIPNLQEITMASAEQERETLQGVIEARASATRPEIQLSGDDLNDPAKMAAFSQAQNQLGGALARLMVTVEQYPELRSQENFGRFMTQIEGQENRIRVAIRDYNEAVRQYNTTIRTFPDIIGAKVIHGAEPMVPYEAVTAGAEVAPTLDMRSGN
ncbi:LemA family protein [Alteraurantiacibacter palmitatis]|uniref:LemA family protein n=1 Tax=Alteraurantiacibacter palmitatis TaxID=2054628 RepID=A0ABV7E6L2_9SPHN